MNFFVDHYKSVRYPISTESNPGLRRSQLGAIHSIAAHFTRYNNKSNFVDPAIVVMPTGSGKTSVLILSAFVLRAKRVLVITPSRFIRSQVAEQFQGFELLRRIGALIGEFREHKVYKLESKLTSRQAWENLQQYDVVVSTPNCVSPAYEDIFDPPSDLFDLLLIDEAHHVPAKTWSNILEVFPRAKKVLFTATPFRRDKREIVGDIVYEFSIREAFADKIFGKIDFEPVRLLDNVSSDVAIAIKTEEIYQKDRENGYLHCVLVRTNTKKHASELIKVYENHTNLRLRLIHSGHSDKYVKQTIDKLSEKDLDGIICVDMLAEGFDFPSLKIASVHAPYKSLAVTLQFIGRFARTNGEHIGKATFIAVPQNIKTDVDELYKKEKIWQEIIPDLYEERVEREISNRHTLSKFQTVVSTDLSVNDYIKDISLYSLTPFHHVKIYKLQNGININNDLELSGMEIVRKDTNEDLSSIIFLTKEVRIPRWATSQKLACIEYGLFVLYYNIETHLLFINSSVKSAAVYNEIVKQVAIGTYRPLMLCELNKVLVNLNSSEFFNIGMRNRIINSQTESYRIITGASAHRAIRSSDGKLYHRGHVFGRGDLNHKKTTLGYSSTSKVWSNSNSSIPEFIEWCELLARNIMSEQNVTTGSKLDQLPVGELLSEVPNNDDFFVVDWNKNVYQKAYKLVYQVNEDCPKHNCEMIDIHLSIDRNNLDAIRVMVQGPDLEWKVKFNPLSFPHFNKVLDNQKDVAVLKGKEEISLVDFLNSYPLCFYMVDRSLIVGSQIFREVESLEPYSSDKIEAVDWDLKKVDIEKEFGEPEDPDEISIHQYLRGDLVKSDVDIVFYDHGTGEVADFITFKRTNEGHLLICLYHVKSSGGPNPSTRGRVNDVYEVCGQVVKSLIWLRKDKLRDRICDRLNNQTSSFVKGRMEDLDDIINSQIQEQYEEVVVQPGISKNCLSDKIANILAAAEDYIISAGCNNLRVIASS